MGRRSREEYLRHLQRALDDLQAINFRFQQRGDLVAARDDLNRWKKTTMVTIEEHGAIEDGRRFQIHVDFDVLGLTGGYVLEGIEKYESFLRDLVKTSSTSSLGDLGGVSGEGTEDLEDSERSPMAAEERNRNLNRVGNRKKVFVVHGRNEAARVAMFQFLRALDLEPIEWGEAVAWTRTGTPYVGTILDRAFEAAQAVIVLFTGDDLARLGTRYLSASDPPEEGTLTPQPRPNVLFEAGMAFGRNPERTILVVLGQPRPFSDIAGLHVVRMDDSPARRQELISRLKSAGCATKQDGRTDWLNEGSFEGAIREPDIENREAGPFLDGSAGGLFQPRAQTMTTASRAMHQGKPRPALSEVEGKPILSLCLFDPSTAIGAVQGRIHACGIHDDKNPSPIGELDAQELLEKTPTWPSQAIAAHVTGSGGLFRALQAGQARSAIWKHKGFLACSLPGPVSDAPDDVRQTLENKNPDYVRDRPVAVLNCQDIRSPEDLAKPGTSCYVKMTAPTIEGLRQAFLDPGSRVRLLSDPAPEEHIEFLGMTWETEGFLRGCRLHLNENLNVLIGGRGSGKSTMIESLRYVLGIEPIGEDAKRVHNGIVQSVLRSGTKISLAVQSYRPDKRRFLIERTVPSPPRVIDDKGNVLSLKPLDVVPGVAVFGQSELAELARSPDKLTALLHRFIPVDTTQDTRMQEISQALQGTRREILECETKIQKDQETLTALPGIQETLDRYREAGVEEKLKTQALIIKAEGVVDGAEESLVPFRSVAEDLAGGLPVSQDFLSDEALEGLPAHADLVSLRAALATFEASAKQAMTALQAAIAEAERAVGEVAAKVAGEKSASQADYEKTLRDLQKARIDGSEFIRLRQDLGRLAPLKAQLAKTEQRLKDLLQKRRNDLAIWDDLKRERYQRLERAAKKVSRELPNRLRVTVAYGGNRDPLTNLLKQEPGGRLSETITALSAKADLSVSALADSSRQGTAALVKEFGIPATQADRIAKAGSKLPMLIEELELPHVTEIELNVGPENAPPEWRRLDQLSTGQKATALLYLLLMDSPGPLVLDQPEDNLDNRFISEGVVPKIRSEKRRRQFVFSTHNANIPVLGDAELIVVMRAVGEAGDGYAEVPPEHMGSIDKDTVARLVEEILEGGKEAFQTRQLKYGF